MSNIKFATPDVGWKEIDEICDTVESGWLTNGPKVREFERRIAEMSGCDRAVAFDSWTGAMEMTLRALGIGPGDEVITTPYTYSATAEVIRNVGATIVFVDLDDDELSFEMNYGKVAAAITERTKAVMPVDIGGKLCNYDALMAALQEKRSLFQPSTPLQEAIGRVVVVADAAHSFGADCGSRVCGQFADFTCFSFHVLKNITTGGEGGAVVWRDFCGVDNSALERALRLLGDHGQTSRNKNGGWEYDIVLFGYNSIMTDVDAAMGLAQLDRFDEIRQKRIEVTCRYDELFDRLASDRCRVTPVIRHFGPDYTSAMHLYPIKLNLPETYTRPRDMAEQARNRVYQTLNNLGIPCNVHYKPLPMMTAYKSIGFNIADYPRAYEMYRDLLTIPYHTELTAAEQERIVLEIGEAVSRL